MTPTPTRSSDPAVNEAAEKLRRMIRVYGSPVQPGMFRLLDEALAAAPSLDVDRLARAIGPVDQCYLSTHASHHDPQYADVLVTRITVESDAPTPVRLSEKGSGS